jgi:hypothetical protein
MLSGTNPSNMFVLARNARSGLEILSLKDKRRVQNALQGQMGDM